MPTKPSTAKTNAKTTPKSAGKTTSKAAAAAPKAAAKAKTETKKAAAVANGAIDQAAEAALPLESVAAANQETMETMLKAGSQAAGKSYEEAFTFAQEQVEKASEVIFKRYDDVADLGQDNVDAYVRSTTAFSKGFETLSNQLMSMVQGALEANMATTKALFEAKTLRELIDLQTEFSRSSFDNAVAESAKLTEMSMALANEAIEPIQVSMNATVEKFMKPIAA